MFNNFMKNALQEAFCAFDKGEVPVGAVLVKDSKILASCHNLSETLNASVAHAEMLVLQRGFEVCGKSLHECDLYVTLEPCPMCAYAISLSRIRRLYFGAVDKKNGCVVSNFKIYNNTLSLHKPEIYSGILSHECSDVLTRFFKEIRQS